MILVNILNVELRINCFMIKDILFSFVFALFFLIGLNYIDVGILILVFMFDVLFLIFKGLVF